MAEINEINLNEISAANGRKKYWSEIVAEFGYTYIPCDSKRRLRRPTKGRECGYSDFDRNDLAFCNEVCTCHDGDSWTFIKKTSNIETNFGISYPVVFKLALSNLDKANKHQKSGFLEFCIQLGTNSVEFNAINGIKAFEVCASIMDKNKTLLPIQGADPEMSPTYLRYYWSISISPKLNQNYTRTPFISNAL